MSINQIRMQVCRTRSVTLLNPAAAWVGLGAALLFQLAGTTTALGQSTPATPAGAAAPAPKNGGAQPFKNDADKAEKSDKNDTEKVHVDENQIVDLHVNDEDLSNVLEMLSIQSQKNIIASKGVSARVTANLYGVTFFEALDAILNINGFGYIQQDNFIMVYTKEELKKIVEEQRVKLSKMITLNYLTAIDAAEFVKPLLSETGQIKTNGKTMAFQAAGAVPNGADDYANSTTLVIYDFDDHVVEIEALLKQLDTRPAQVLVEATIMQTTLNEANAFGVDFSIIADMDFGDFVKLGGPMQAVNGLIGGRADTSGAIPLPADGNGRAITSTVGNTAGPGGLKLGFVKNDLAMFLRVLDEVTDTTILSNPKILALNRQSSRVLVGRKVGYLSTTSTDTATTQTVEFLDTGTQLSFRPFVTNEGLIRMELKPQVSEAVIRDTNDSNGKSVTIPDEVTNELSTNVLVHDGQTVVLGGLFRESTTSSRRQIPFLGDIPIVGAAFRGNDDTTQRNEIIFLITPTIVNDETIATQGERSKAYIDHLRVGSREGVLFWSRDKLTSMMNVEAERSAEAGDTERALWKVQRSLCLNHNQPEVIALREKLTGKKSMWPTRSFLDRVFQGDPEPMLRGGKARTGADDATNGPLSTIAPINVTEESPDNVPFTPMAGTTSTTAPIAQGPEAANGNNNSNPEGLANNTGTFNQTFTMDNNTDTTTAQNGRVWIGRHTLMGGMWSFVQFMNSGSTTTPNTTAVTEVKDQVETFDNK